MRKLRLGVQIVSNPTNRFPGILTFWEIYAKLFGVLVLVLVETGSHVAWNGLELTIEPRITMNLLFVSTS